MSHTPWKLLSSFWAARLAWAIVTLFTLAAHSNAQDILQPYAPPILGAPLRRIPVDKCFDFWESEVKRHLLSPQRKVDRSKMPDACGYIASEWSGHIEVPIVLLEKAH